MSGTEYLIGHFLVSMQSLCLLALHVKQVSRLPSRGSSLLLLEQGVVGSEES